MHLKLQNRTPSLFHPWIFFISSFGADFVFAPYTKLFQQCVAQISFVPCSQPLTSEPEICNPLWTLVKELSLKITSSTTHWILFFYFSFFCPQPKAEADSFICASFLVVCFHLLVLMLPCDYISSFLCSSVFFVFPRICHSGFGRLYQSSDALVGGIVGIRLTPSVVIIYFFGNSFFPYYAMINNQSFFFGCLRGTISWSKNLSYLIALYDIIFESIFGNKQ